MKLNLVNGGIFPIKENLTEEEKININKINEYYPEL